MKRVIVVLGLALLVACAGNLPPVDTGQILCLAQCKGGVCEKTAEGAWVCVKTCPVCPEGQECTDPVKGCVPKPVEPPAPPGPVCAAGQFCNCYHNPTGEEWLLASCPTGQQCNTAKQCVAATPVCPTCPAGYECKDPAVGCVPKPPTPPGDYCKSPLNPDLLPPVLPDADWTDAGVPQGTLLKDSVDAAIKRTQTKCPAIWASDRCLMKNAAGIDEGYQNIARELQGAGIVAGQGSNDNNPKADHLTIGRPSTDAFEEWKLFSYGDGCLTGSPYKGAVRPKLPPTSGCTNPVTPKVNRFNMKAHHRVNDATPLFYGRETERWDGVTITGYCEALGMGDKLYCPARNECPGVKCQERVACESIGVSGVEGGKPLWRSDGSVNLTDNPYQASCSDCTWIEICAADGTACKRCETDGGVCK